MVIELFWRDGIKSNSTQSERDALLVPSLSLSSNYI